jgi:hypothetical protein
MREDGPPWALLEFGRAIRIAVRVVEEGGQAFKEGCLRGVCGGTMMSIACCGGLGTILHTIEKGWRYSMGLNRWTSRSIAIH